MIELLAVLTVAAQVAVVLALVAWLLRVAGRPAASDWLVRVVGPDATKIAWLVAAVATAGSLYMSEVRHFPPCVLCWYQRIAMYPLVLVLGIAAIRRDRAVGWYAIPLALVGGAVSAYHVQLEWFPEQETVACSTSVPCTTVWFQQFGYITISMMALSAFALVVVLSIIGGRHGKSIQGQA